MKENPGDLTKDDRHDDLESPLKKAALQTHNSTCNSTGLHEYPGNQMYQMPKITQVILTTRACKNKFPLIVLIKYKTN